jgi:hypothetical protein
LGFSGVLAKFVSSTFYSSGYFFDDNDLIIFGFESVNFTIFALFFPGVLALVVATYAITWGFITSVLDYFTCSSKLSLIKASSAAIVSFSTISLCL